MSQFIISTKTPRSAIIEFGKKCKSCGHCCKYGAGYVIEEDIPQIAKHLGITEDDFIKTYLTPQIRLNKKIYKMRTVKTNEKKAYGMCIFFDEDRKCLIHDVKPFYCRIATCEDKEGEALQWFDINILLDKEDPEAIRQWNSFLRFKEPIVGGKIEDIVPEEELRREILGYHILRKEDMKARKSRREE